MHWNIHKHRKEEVGVEGRRERREKQWWQGMTMAMNDNEWERYLIHPSLCVEFFLVSKVPAKPDDACLYPSTQEDGCEHQVSLGCTKACQVDRHVHHNQFHVVLGIETRTSGILGKHFSNWTMSWAPPTQSVVMVCLAQGVNPTLPLLSSARPTCLFNMFQCLPEENS